MKTPLYDALLQHKMLGRASFHTPGHKNRWKKLFKLDYTELPDTDSLYEANAAIKEAENLAAELYGAERTLFSAGGCTLCIQTMLKLALPYGGKVIASRMIHKSAVNAMAMLNARPVWMLPKIDEENGFWDLVSANEIEQQILQNHDVACVYITSPDYYGHIADVRSIAEMCHHYGVPLLVDNAHGSHLKFLQNDLHPITLGADMSADSVHKTLPVLTGGALLHIANEKYVQGAKSAMSVFGSTSPSYPIMASIDTCRAWLQTYGKTAFVQLERKVDAIKNVAMKRGILDGCKMTDPIRITLNTAKIGVNGNESAEHFRARGIEPEFSDEERVVFIATPMNSARDLAKLEAAIKDLPEGTSLGKVKRYTQSIPAAVLPMHEALFALSESVPISNAEGRISTETICPCPPGIPILLPGEAINQAAIKKLSAYRIATINVIK